MRKELEQTRDWASTKLTTGAEPPWSWCQLMKLQEAVDGILAGMPPITTENSPQLAQHPGVHLRL